MADEKFTGPYGRESHCGKCGGMVNFNGCGQADCPVKPAEPKASAKPKPTKG